jgi:histone acetyltransferase (RNA polymerase elongator complex component)
MKPLIVPFFISHRGCPHRCIFCDQTTISGSAGDIPATAEILAKISAYRDTAAGRPIEAAFYGGTFTALPCSVQQRLLQPLQPLIVAGTLQGVRISTRPDAVDPDIVHFLKEMGVRTVELGVQSMDDGVLARAGRGHTAADSATACHALQAAGMAVGVQIMVGLPGDTPARALASLRRVLALKPGFLRIYPTLVIAGTRLEGFYQAGEYAPLTVDGAVRCCKILVLEALRAGVPVIRSGLQDTPELRNPGNVVAGPHHPAFRQLVEGELFFDLLLELTGEAPHDRPLTLVCAPSRISDVAGQRRANVQRLYRSRGLKIAAIKGDPLFSPLDLQVTSDSFVRKGNIVHDLAYRAEVSPLDH